MASIEEVYAEIAEAERTTRQVCAEGTILSGYVSQADAQRLAVALAEAAVEEYRRRDCNAEDYSTAVELHQLLQALLTAGAPPE